MSARCRRAVVAAVMVALLGTPPAVAGWKAAYKKIDPPPAEEVIGIWDAWRKVLVKAGRDEKFTIQGFERALRFFEELTCIPSTQPKTRYGKIPGESLRGDLARWDDWFATHAHQLSPDGEDRLRGAPPCGGKGG